MHSKIISKIKKLLELANSPNEAEAKLAFSRAQELIQKYAVNITEDIKEQVIEVEYIPPIKSPSARPFIPEIAFTIASMFGCISLVGNKREARLIGFPTNIEIATFAIDSILNQLNADCKEGIKKHRSLSFAAAFWDSAASTIRKRFTQHKEVGKGLILYDHARAFVDEKYPKLGKYSANLNSSSLHGLESGRISGNAAQIRHGVQSHERGNLLK